MAKSEKRRTRVDQLPAEELTKVLGQLGHEVGTPLGSVLMLAEMLADSGAASADAGLRRRAEGLKQAATEIRDVVQAFVRLVRLRTGWLGPRPAAAAPADLVETVTSAGKSLGLEIEASGTDLHTDLFTDMEFLADAVDLCCRWAAERGGEPAPTLTVDVAEEIRLRLRSPGGALPWGEAAILDPLGAGDLVPARRHGGGGLELALAHALAWRLGGSLAGRFDEAAGENVLDLKVPSRLRDPLA